MCRFVMYMGNPLRLDLLTTRPSHSIIHQSYNAREREEPLNGDGFGIAWYAPDVSEEAAVFRSITPAWNNSNLRNIARVTESDCILAHVRAATPGLPVIETNCHPFTHGKYTFMHNGYIPQFGKVKRALQRRLSDRAYQSITGTTDSEHTFGLFIDAIQEGGVLGMAKALERTIAQVVEVMAEVDVKECAQLNLAVTDGTHAVCSRFVSDPNAKPNTLYVHEGKAYTCNEGRCEMVDHDQGHTAILVASEPLSRDEGWDLVPANHLALIERDKDVHFEEIAILR